MEPQQTIFLFGEAEKGEYCTPLPCRSLTQLYDTLGNAPDGSEGIFFAVQALTYQRELIFFRIQEEGFHTSDYMQGFKVLKKFERPLSALFMPGVGDEEIINSAVELCCLHQCLLVLGEKDLYDYLTMGSIGEAY